MRRAARPGRHGRGHGRQASAVAAAPIACALPHLCTTTTPATITLTYFNARRDYLEKLLPIGETRYVSGTAEFYDGMLQMVHPDRVVDEAGFADAAAGRAGLSADRRAALGNVRRAVDGALAAPARAARMAGRSLAGARAAFRLSPRRCGACIARPSRRDILQRTRHGRGLPMTNCWPASSRLRWCARICAGRRPRAAPATDALRDAHPEGPALHAHAFAAAGARRHRDRPRLPERMLRLLQGDVGSARRWWRCSRWRASIEAGRQAALWRRPRSWRASIYNTIAPLAEAAGMRVAILTGRERGREREEILDRLALGDIDLLVGTHALFQEDVAFRDLALAVVDEQHRFGVHQRLALTRKGEAVDMLVHDGDADPAHAGAHLFRRHGHVGAARKAGRPPADRHPRHAARPPRRSGRRGRPRARRGPARLLGLSAGRGIREDRLGGRAGPLRRAAQEIRRRRSAWCMAA